MVYLLIIASVVIGFLIYQLIKTKRQLKRYQGIIDLESEQNKIKKENEELTKKANEIKLNINDLEKRQTKLEKDVIDLNETIDLQTYGLYEPQYDFATAEGFKAKLKEIRSNQKSLIKEKKAVDFNSEWTVEGSKAKGKAMMNRQTKLMLRAFNGECDSLIVKVKYNNIQSIEQRISRSFDAINKMGETVSCRINSQYLDLKVQELHLAYEYEEKRQAELEEQRAIREQMREEQRALKEIEKAKRAAEKEEEQYQKALEKAKKDIEKATGDQQLKLQAEIDRLTQQLEVAEENKERAIARAQLTRSGHVYVISNIGSFGENIYKIGMTRRLEPIDRVKELGDASVPFTFDVHAMIYSDDAPGLEAKLHKAFDEKRVNRINYRKEFFKVSLDEIQNVVCENNSEIEFTLIAEAKEFRETQTLLLEQ